MVTIQVPTGKPVDFGVRMHVEVQLTTDEADTLAELRQGLYAAKAEAAPGRPASASRRDTARGGAPAASAPCDGAWGSSIS